MDKAKPIFVMKIPVNVPWEEHDRIQKNLSAQFQDYHVLLISCLESYSEPKCEVYYDKDVTEIQIEELRTALLKEMKENASK